MGYDDVSWRHLDCLLYDRHNEALDDILLFVVNSDSDVRALLDLVALKRLIGDSFVVGDRPMIA